MENKDNKNFILGIETPEDRLAEDRKVRNQVAHYVLQEKKLYRREANTGTFPLRLCITMEEGWEIDKSVHGGGGGAHQGSKKLYLKISRQGYFWITIRIDTKKITRECLEWQKYADLQHSPSVKLSPYITPILFVRWGLDIIGSFPMASKGRKFTFVTVDYFTK